MSDCICGLDTFAKAVGKDPRMAHALDCPKGKPEPCEECGTELVEVDQPTPLRVFHCPKCAEEGPSEQQIQQAMDAAPPRLFTMFDKDDPDRYKP